MLAGRQVGEPAIWCKIMNWWSAHMNQRTPRVA
jgi:hypothetical protein